MPKREFPILNVNLTEKFFRTDIPFFGMTEEARKSNGLPDKRTDGSLLTFASFADDSIISISSTDLNASVFSDCVSSDDQSSDDPMSITPSISDTVEIDYEIESSQRKETPLSNAYNVLGRRFEKAIGTSNYSNDVVKVSTVSNRESLSNYKNYTLAVNLGY